EAVPAFEEVELSLDGHIRRRPVVGTVLHVEVPAADVGRNVVVPVASQPPKARIAIEAISAGLVRDEPEEVLAPQIVDPRVGGPRCRNDVFAASVVEMAKSHGLGPPGRGRACYPQSV